MSTDRTRGANGMVVSIPFHLSETSIVGMALTGNLVLAKSKFGQAAIDEVIERMIAWKRSFRVTGLCQTCGDLVPEKPGIGLFVDDAGVVLPFCRECVAD